MNKKFCLIIILSIGIIINFTISESISASGIPDNFTDLAESGGKTVVNIRTQKTIKGGGPVFRHFFRAPGGDQDQFNDFFNKFFGEENQKEFKERSLGSGFIIDKEGYIVTNNHVIEEADEIKVKINSGEEFSAKIIGRDPNTDIALIKIKPEKDLPSIKLGDSDALKVGQWVVAIGNPFGLDHTVTAGIVSAKGRVIGAGPYDDFIQTDASINPGNSGGPLLNMAGEVIGINTAIVAQGQGIGFAIPVNLAKGIIEQLKQSGEVSRGWLGVAIQDITPEIAEYSGTKAKKGVFVTEVFPGDPADKAGIQAKDIIIAVDGKKVETSRELTRLVAGIKVGKTAEITLIRDGKEKTFDVTIAQRQDSKIASLKGGGNGKIMPSEDDLGIRVSDLTPEITNRYNIPDKDGVIVIGVEQGSKADQAGLSMGDIIKEINHKRIKTVDDYKATVNKAKKGDTITLFAKRARGGIGVIKIEK
ncbi:MAG: DegQ family serine endoprotease [Desulfobacterales bacterium]|nr:DegQ family serine endoprotease [Desulfobacterales bacterium]MBF0397545.1 DegQ family serine endoprotease [Desulfobacterales bacterium]